MHVFRAAYTLHDNVQGMRGTLCAAYNDKKDCLATGTYRCRHRCSLQCVVRVCVFVYRDMCEAVVKAVSTLRMQVQLQANRPENLLAHVGQEQ